MKKYHIIPLIFLITICITACEKIVDNVDIPSQQPKLVVNCYISPEDTIIKATVYASAPIWSVSAVDSYTPVSTATVKISDNNTEKQLIYNSQKGEYVLNASSFPIQEDVVYKLSVSAPGFTSVVASCKVPLQINKSLLFLSFDSVVGDQYSTEYKFRTEFTDFSGLGNYYRIGGYIIALYNDSIGGVNDTTYNSLSSNNNKEFMADKDNDGQKVQSELNYWKYNYDDGMGGGEKLLGLKLFLLTTEENYYKFHKSMSNYVGDDPFSEPTIAFSNFNNGLGVFGAYRKFTIDYTFPN